jgi:NAD(P)-dependent dehydrogenase (short-subunit alcohol dehydrogenase family)
MPPAEGKTGGIPGIGSAIVERLLPAGDAVRRCPTCAGHAKRRAAMAETVTRAESA